MAVETQTRGLAIPLPVYIALGLALVGASASWYFIRTAPQPAAPLTLTPEAKQYLKFLPLSDIEIKDTESYLGQRVFEIRGKITNTGDRAIRVVEVFCVFHDAYGQVVLRQRLPILSGRMGGLKPSESKSFRLPFDAISTNWNQQMPQLVIAAIQFS